jgi:DNA-directed RNA polymerase subunit RPC12/RpoP
MDQDYKQHILRIFDPTTNTELNIDDITISVVSNKFSNTGVPVWRIFNNGIPITRNNKYKAETKCFNCGKNSISALNNIGRKLNKTIRKCDHCTDSVIEKITKQKQGSIDDPVYKEEKNTNILAFITYSERDFYEFDSDYTDNYFRRHLSLEEFERIREYMIDYQNGIKNIKDIIYCPVVKVSNQNMFCPKFYDKVTNTLEKCIYIKYKCQNCSLEFVNKDLYTQKNKWKILCQECNLTNNLFKIKTARNCCGDTILYQSKFELKFMRFCNEHKIVVKNGPKIPYIWNGRPHTYKIDFYIPKSKLLIEIKDNYCWHKDNVSSGKWASKLNGVNDFINVSGDTFICIFPKEYVKITKNILINYFN